jgi:micrococcal nuclease
MGSSHIATAALVSFVMAIVLMASACAAPTADADSNESPGLVPVVESIVDGDTIRVSFGSSSEPVRLLGIDTPESVDPARPVQCFGVEATGRITELIPPGTELRLEIDREPRDQYGRLLAYVYRASDDLFVNLSLLVDGFAALSIYPPNDTYRAQLEQVAQTAHTANVGFWSACGGADVPVDPPPVAQPEDARATG